jgi:hypothetical protein
MILSQDYTVYGSLCRDEARSLMLGEQVEQRSHRSFCLPL